jgi:hypothetical protein
VKDIGTALFRIGLILVPAAIIERWSSLHANGLSDTLGLLIRGLLYSLIALALLIVTRSHLWFLARRPGETTN